MVSVADQCKRALVIVIRALAAACGSCVTVTRDSPDAVVKRAYRTLSKKVHPDHGGSTADQQRLNAAYEAWCEALRDKSDRGRPPAGDGRGMFCNRVRMESF